MNILVCFKVLPEPDRVLTEDWEGFSQQTDLSYAGMDFSCFDGAALELGLQLKEQMAEQGMVVTCSALTLGEALPESFSQRLYSIGYDRVLEIPVEGLEFAPEATAARLAAAAAEADLILTGREAGMGQTGMVPYLMAERLRMPLHGDVETACFREQRLEICCRKPRGLYKRECDLPALLTVGNSPAVLRAATLRQQMKSRGRKPELFSPEPRPSAGWEGSFCPPPTKRACQMLDPGKEDTFPFIRALIGKAEAPAAAGEQNPVLAELQQAAALKKVFLFPDTEGGRLLAVRTAQEQGIRCCFGGQVTALSDRGLTIRQPVCGSNLTWVRELPYPLVLTGDYEGPEQLRQEQLLEPEEETGLLSADVVLICGNGMGSRAGCLEGRALAKQLGAGFGLTRPCAVNAWGSPAEIVGQSGKILAPGLCITLGAAGAGAFLAGIRKSRCILAVNTDPHALIFKGADFGILMDAGEFLKRLKEEVEKP